MIKGVVINPRGCNASGKTTAVREFIKSFPEAHLINVGPSTVTQCTDRVFVLGRYDKKNGGCDGYSGRAQIEKTINALIALRNPLVIVYEGMLYSTSAKLAQDLDKALRPRGYYYQGIYLHRPLQSILTLLEARNGGAGYNVAGIYDTYRANGNAYKALKASKTRIVKVEADTIALEEMGNLIWAEIPKEIREQL